MFTSSVPSIRNAAASSSSTPAGPPSSTPAGPSSSTPAASGSSLFDLLSQKAASQAEEPDMSGENGDPCHFDLGYYSKLQEQLMSETLGLEQQLVGNDSVMLQKIIHKTWPKVTAGLDSLPPKDRQMQIVLLFKLAFFARAIRCQGGRSRVQFYLLFQRLRGQFPRETLSVVKLIPFYGCFQDVDHMVNVFRRVGDEEMVLSLLSLYRDSLVADMTRLLGKPVAPMLVGDLHTKIDALNRSLKAMNPAQLSDFIKTLPPGEFSWAGKWVKREGKKNSAHRDDLVRLLFGYSVSSSKKTMDFGRMVLRKWACVLSQCLRIPEQHMTEALPGRGWGDLNLKFIPSRATTGLRLALTNKTKAGGERSTDEGRRQCAQNTLEAIMNGKLNGAQQDLKKLADLIWNHVESDSYGYQSKSSSVLTHEERMLLNAQWKKMVEFVNQLIEETLEKDRKLREEALVAGEAPLEPMRDPRAVMCVCDVSGSMSYAGVMHYAIAMGILCATISTIPGILITFSHNPEVFRFDPTADIFDVFRQVRRCSWGTNTNLDAVYQLLIQEMQMARDAGKSISTDFSLLIVTDGQFDHMVNVGDSTRGLPRHDAYSSFHTRQEKAFWTAGFGVPLVVYWNMALDKPGFPVQSSMTGVKLVAGFSQTVMAGVMTGDYPPIVDPKTGAVKVGVTPLESFKKKMNDDSLQSVEDALRDFWSTAAGPAASSPAASGPAASSPDASGPAASSPTASGPAASDLASSDGWGDGCLARAGMVHDPLAPPVVDQDVVIADLKRQVQEAKAGQIAKLRAQLAALES